MDDTDELADPTAAIVELQNRVATLERHDRYAADVAKEHHAHIADLIAHVQRLIDNGELTRAWAHSMMPVMEGLLAEVAGLQQIVAELGRRP